MSLTNNVEAITLVIADKNMFYSQIMNRIKNKRLHISLLGWPKLLWFVTESKHLSKPPRDWFPHIKDANNDTAYIEVGTVYFFQHFFKAQTEVVG